MNYFIYNKNVMKPVPIGEGGYFADINGDIFSAWTTGKNAHIDLNRIKKIKSRTTKRCKYLSFTIRFKNKIYKNFLVHKAVCLAFHGFPENSKMTASHLDGNILNNKPSNILWETQQDNLKRKYEHGTDDKGFHNSRALINEQQYNEIKTLLKEKKLTHKEIGKLYNVSRVFITKINCGCRYNFDVAGNNF